MNGKKTRGACLFAAALGVWGWCSGAARAQPLAWAHAGDQADTSDLALAYDTVNHVTLCFSGYLDHAYTFEWDGGAWALRSAAGPSPRFGHAMAYDSARGRAVMFGGSGQAAHYNQTWEWDSGARAWSLRPTPPGGPAARQYGAMVYDAARRVCVLFGGESADLSGFMGDTWEWNGAAWTTRGAGTVGPAARSGLAMAFDTARGVTVLFGGVTSASPITLSDEVWELGATGGWVRRTPRHAGDAWPSARVAHAMAYNPRRRVAVMHGGYVGGTPSSPVLSDETWEWDGSGWTRRMIPGPPPTAQHAVAFDVDRGVVVLQGGYARDLVTPSDATWELSGTPRAACVADVDDGSGTGTPDGGVTVEDLLYYLGLYAAGSMGADIDDGSGTNHPDGGVTIDDLLYYLARYAVGC